MRKNLLLLSFLGLLLSGLSPLSAQVVEAIPPSPLVNDLEPMGIHRNYTEAGTVTCSRDTVQYPQAKASNFRAITMNLNSSATRMAQVYDAPQPITVHGFEFYAWSPSATNANNTNVTMTCRLYNAGLDSLPTGTPLATTTVTVDTNFGTGAFSFLRKVATFTNPVTVSNRYVLSVEMSSAISVAVSTSDWDSADGLNEWLVGIAVLGQTTWLHGYGVNVGGVPFNADILIQPHVTYDLTADFSSNPGCLTTPTTVNFTNQSSGVLGHRMYNVAVFSGLPELSSSWDFGDGSPQVYAVDTSHAYTMASAYTVTLYDTLFGWNTTCFADTGIQFATQSPNASFTNSGTSLTINFNNTSSNGTTYSWNFGDGNGSTMASPSHTYQSIGLYTVTLIATNGCGSDTTIQTVNVACLSPAGGFLDSLINIGTYQFTDTTNGSTSWSWDFGDGFGTSTMQNPTYNYSQPGTYTVTLIVSNICGSDTVQRTITVTCPTPTAGFTVNSSGNTATFTDGSTLAFTWNWDFGDGNTSMMQNPVHNYNGSGTYTVTLIVGNPCGADTIVQQVTINCPTPAAGFTSSTNNTLQVSFTDQSTNTPTAWSWDFGDGSGTSTMQNPSYIYSAQGMYLVTLIATNACGNDTTTDSVNVIIVNTPDPALSSVTIFPNPGQGLFNLEFGRLPSGAVEASIINPLGQVMRRQRWNSVTGRLSLDLSTFSEGVYFLKLESKQGEIVRRLNILH